MADNQDKLSPKDQQMLEDLEKQLTQPSGNNSTAKTNTAANTSASTTAKRAPSNTEAPKASASNPYKSAPARPVAQAKTGFLWFFTLVNLLLLIGVFAAGYWVWMQWQNEQQKQDNYFAQQEASLAAQQSNVANQQAEIQHAIDANQLIKEDWQKQSQTEQERLDILASAIQQNSQQVANNLGKLNEIAGRRPADWLLAEANYLLNIAGRKLWLEHDVTTAILMLQAADSRLQDIDDASLLAIREKLANDITALQQVTPISTSDIALKISGLTKQVDSLALTFFQKPQLEQATVDISTDESDWKTNLMTSINHVLDGFFSIKKINTDVKPFMSEQQQWLVKEQLKFTLLNAQTAALQEQWPLFTETLKHALNLLNQHFDSQQNNVIQFTDSLNELLNSELESNYPQQFAASNALKDAMNSRLGNRFTNGNN